MRWWQTPAIQTEVGRASLKLATRAVVMKVIRAPIMVVGGIAGGILALGSRAGVGASQASRPPPLPA